MGRISKIASAGRPVERKHNPTTQAFSERETPVGRYAVDPKKWLSTLKKAQCMPPRRDSCKALLVNMLRETLLSQLTEWRSKSVIVPDINFGSGFDTATETFNRNYDTSESLTREAMQSAVIHNIRIPCVCYTLSYPS